MVSPSHAHTRHGIFSLILLTLPAIAFNVALVYGLVAVVRLFYCVATAVDPNRFTLAELWQPELFCWTAIITLGMIFLASSVQTIILLRGGKAVVRILGARLADPERGGPRECLLPEITEELAVATGLPAPAVYVMDRTITINALSAGRNPRGAVIIVTQGALDYLEREELKALLAHEFCHIRSGDIRFDLRLAGLLHGIMFIGWLGAGMMNLFGGRSVNAMFEDFGPFRSTGYDSGSGVGCMLLCVLLIAAGFGFLLLGIGCAGQNVARAIRNRISRRRELAVDAEAAALTGNPLALASVLKKVGAVSQGSRILNWRAEQFSHAFFCDAVTRPEDLEHSTHPPLAERIRALDPEWNGKLTEFARPCEEHPKEFTIPDEDPFYKPLSIPTAAASDHREPAAPARRTVEMTDDLGNRARALRGAIPDALNTLAHRSDGVCVVFYALALAGDEAARQAQLDALQPRLEAPLAEPLRQAMRYVDALTPEERLALADVAAESLHKVPKWLRKNFPENLKLLITADGRIEPFEFLIYRMVLRRLGLAARPIKKYLTGAETHPLVAGASLVAVVLSAMAHAGAEDSTAAGQALAAGVARLGIPGLKLGLLPADQCDLKALDAALGGLLPQLDALSRRQLLEGCAAAIASDRQVRLEEAILLRLAAEALDCTMAPLMPGQRLA